MSSANPEKTDRKIGAGTADAERLALSVNDTCKALSISRAHLYVLAAKGEIKLTRLGARTLVAMSEIRRLLGEVV
jgi:excisionase family DNA binding protein